MSNTALEETRLRLVPQLDLLGVATYAYTTEHYCMLDLRVPVQGKGRNAQGDPWLAGRTVVQAQENLFAVLGHAGGLQGHTPGDTHDRAGNLLELRFGFWYDDLQTAVNRFTETWDELKLPDRTRLTHIERFPDCSFQFHVMIRWIGGKMDPYSTVLSGDNLLTPRNG
jgi:hypothetical protein